MCYIDGGHTFHLSDGAMVRLIATHVARSVVSLYQTWNWVIGSPRQWVIWVIFLVRVTGSSF